MVRWAALLAGILGAVMTLGACYGSTEPAGDVTFSSATLKASGTADNGPAYSFLQYGPTGMLAAVRETTRRSWPAGASGPISEPVGPLYAGTAYSFRLCGGDEGASAVCTPTRSFTTPAATRDAVKGSWTFRISPHAANGSVDATSGPQGQNPSGSLNHRISESSPDRFIGFVTCLAVSGSRAAVGAVGNYVYPPTGVGPRATSLVTILDSGPGQKDRILVTQVLGSTPPVCSTAGDATSDTFEDGLVVYDAP